MTVEVRLDPAALRALLRDRNGPAGRALLARTEEVADIARREAPGSMPDFITAEVVETRTGLEGVITSAHRATNLVLQGTRPHLIRPRNARALRFEIGAQVVYSRLVHHPGTKANDFLGRALEAGR